MLQNIDKAIINYLNVSRKNRSIKGLNNIEYNFVYSKKSESKYLKLQVELGGKIFYKQIRISDHLLKGYEKTQFIIVEQKGDGSQNIMKEICKYIKKEIEKFYVGTTSYFLKTFTLEGAMA